MKKTVIRTMILSCMILCFQYLNAQIYSSQEDIIEDFGEDYKRDTTDSGTEYLIFHDEQETDASGEYQRILVCYFIPLEEKNKKICYKVDYIEPVSEINNWIKYLNGKYVPEDKMEWIDYENNVLYSVQKDKMEDADIVLVRAIVHSDD